MLTLVSGLVNSALNKIKLNSGDGLVNQDCNPDKTASVNVTTMRHITRHVTLTLAHWML